MAPDNVYLVPAIDEAACLYEKAEGAFVWLAPSAHRLPVAVDRMTGPYVRYALPLRRGTLADQPGDRFETLVLNPFVHTTPRSNAGDPIRRGFESAMTGARADIVIKRRHTLDILEEALRRNVVSIRRPRAADDCKRSPNLRNMSTDVGSRVSSARK